ncbi:MAG: hypothetical protein ACR2GR_07515 [Rhodothermales bacterium]
MPWLKNVLVDLAVVALITVATVLDQRWALVLVAIYTPLMLVLKVLPLLPGALPVKLPNAADTPPAWFYHALYAANVGLLAAAQQWVLAGGWLLIWVLSGIADVKAKRPAHAR